MHRSILVRSAICLALLQTACSETSNFKGSPKSTAPQAIDAEPEVAPLTLQVVLPAKEIRSGGKTLQATAIISGDSKSKILWRVDGPEGIDLGKINSNGLYTSPAKLDAETHVKIVAALADDIKVTDSDEVKVIPAEQIFVGCSSGSQIFPIVAEVFKLPPNTQQLPDFAAIQSDKSTTVCMDQYNVPVRNFNDGFPGVPDLSEWFALHTTGKIIIPTAGTYLFRLKSDDGSILAIDGSIVVNNDGQHSPRPVDGSVVLSQGVHDLVLDYFQGPADQIALELFWQTPGTNDFVIVPPSAFQK